MTVRERIKKGFPVTGSWIQTGNTVAAEILAGQGFDFMVVDMEHTDRGEKEFCDIARAVSAASARCEPMARLRENDTLAIRRVLDCGAKGVIIPLVNDAEGAKKRLRRRNIRRRAFAALRLSAPTAGEGILMPMQAVRTRRSPSLL